MGVGKIRWRGRGLCQVLSYTGGEMCGGGGDGGGGVGRR